jgi:hypothetical protein
VSNRLLKLNIGCGSYPKREDNWIHCDLYPSRNADVLFDATKDWPFADNSASTIKSNHSLEHFANWEGFFAGAWKALMPNGVLNVTIPYGLSSAGVADVSHVRYWMPGSFCCFQPGYGESVYNPQLTWPYPFSIEICLLRISPQMRRLVRWPLRRWGMKILSHLVDSYNEISVVMRALKTPEAITHFREHRTPNGIPVQRVMHKYEYEGVPYPGGPVELVFLDQFQLGYVKLADLYQQLEGAS